MLVTTEEANTLRRKVSIILSQRKNTPTYRFSAGKEVQIDFRKEPSVMPFEVAGQIQVADEQLGLLRMLHDSQDNEGQKTSNRGSR